MQEQSQKQFKEMMELFKAKLDAKTSPNPSYPKGGEGKKKKKCPHCGMEVYHKPEACFELERFQARGGMEKQEEHLKVCQGQIHRAVVMG
jgi:hypothetical protein